MLTTWIIILSLVRYQATAITQLEVKGSEDFCKRAAMALVVAHQPRGYDMSVTATCTRKIEP